MELTTEVQALVNAAKAAGHVVKMIKINDKPFIYRSISRKEYRDIQKQIAAKATDMKAKMTPEQFDTESASLKDDAEELLLIRCMISPRIGSELDFKQGDFLAGSVSTIADLVMQSSGFGADVEPETL